MTWIKNLKVRLKLLCMSITFAVFLVAIGGTGFYYLKSSNDKINTMYNDRLLTITNLEECKVLNNAINADLFQLMLSPDTSTTTTLSEQIIQKKDLFHKKLTAYEKSPAIDTYEKKILKEIQQNFETNETMLGNVVSMAVINQKDQAYQLFVNSMAPVSDEITKAFENLTQYNTKESSKLNTQNKKDYTVANFIIWGVILLALAIGVIISRIITGSIVGPLKSMSAYIEKIAQGDLSLKTYNESNKIKLNKDEMGKLGNDIKEMREKLSVIFMKVAASTEHVAASSQELTANAEQSSTGVEEIANAVTIIAQGAEKQLQTVVETSEIINQISESIKETANNTNTTVMVVNKTMDATVDGEKAIETTRNQMNNIEKTVIGLDSLVRKLGERSTEIGQIVDTISGISQQTNLLALNAAIEAARAGEHGKGFAVVADEVRKLAEESQEAAKRISGLITQIQGDTDQAVNAMQEGTSQVKIGMDVVDKAGKSFEVIFAFVQQITKQINEISGAAQKIADGSQTAVHSINQLDIISKEVTDQTQNISASIEEQSASMQEIAGSSENLSQIAEELMLEASKFSL
jgi:methyl-accepting chemotaxis protein